ncbi:hypothetical protein NDU88_000854 [Pleurodeles waltl]|uniref:Uncharacterized protein n=1 Tax=Pleurodeles waltl TaxID=8319 RepID=A0AAV7V996_PLEWA|nr:hypothetical protein NDU88_000854 [Pleurodeles waltl]
MGAVNHYAHTIVVMGAVIHYARSIVDMGNVNHDVRIIVVMGAVNQNMCTTMGHRELLSPNSERHVRLALQVKYLWREEAGRPPTPRSALPSGAAQTTRGTSRLQIRGSGHG